MVNVTGVPSHPLAEGVTVIVATSAVVPVFNAVKLAISPLPEDANPIDVLSFVQE